MNSCLFKDWQVNRDKGVWKGGMAELFALRLILKFTQGIEAQKYLHLFDKTQVRIASFVSTNDKIWRIRPSCKSPSLSWLFTFWEIKSLFQILIFFKTKLDSSKLYVFQLCSTQLNQLGHNYQSCPPIGLLLTKIEIV